MFFFIKIVLISCYHFQSVYPDGFVSTLITYRFKLCQENSQRERLCPTVFYAGREYHASCANFWINLVDSCLPSFILSQVSLQNFCCSKAHLSFNEISQKKTAPVTGFVLSLLCIYILSKKLTLPCPLCRKDQSIYIHIVFFASRTRDSIQFQCNLSFPICKKCFFIM